MSPVTLEGVRGLLLGQVDGCRQMNDHAQERHVLAALKGFDLAVQVMGIIAEHPEWELPELPDAVVVGSSGDGTQQELFNEKETR